ncbi:MAG: T9SS type A sorting domain-containing protein [Candidatus Marinimicrobia bacterium]|nr:T9SS type A sorting domain-containing protein [Candidatus Neomarinimicrobiota bacterium]
MRFVKSWILRFIVGIIIIFNTTLSWAQTIPDNWTGDTGIDIYKEVTVVHAGTFCARVDVQTGTQANCDLTSSSEVAVNAGDTYTFSFWYQSSAHVKARAVYFWTGATTTYRGYTNVSESTWKQFSESGTVPTGATNVLVGIRFYDQSSFVAPEIQYIDDVTFESPSGNSLNVTNGDFESWPTSATPSAISNLTINSLTSSKMNISWTKPSGVFGTEWDGVVVFMRAGASNDATVSSTDGIDFNGNLSFGSGTQSGNSYCATRQTTDANGDIIVTGLSNNTTYYVTAYTYKEVTGDNNDDTWSSAATEVSDEAEVQGITSLTGSPGDSKIDLSWTNYDGAQGTWWNNVIILAKSGSSVDGSPSGDGSAYTASSTFGSGSEIGTGNYVVYKGTGTSVSVTGLSNGTTYYFRAFVVDGTDWTDSDQYQDANATPVILPNAWINEIHYDNNSTDANEGVEIIVENSGSYTLSNFQINLYNGSDGTSYDSNTLDQFTSGTTTSGFTYYSLMWSGIQNGPDGMALSYNGNLIQFLSYEGTFSGSGGPADGVTSTDIGISEDGTGSTTTSLQLTGSGTKYSDFTWTADLAQTWGTPNNAGDQSLPVTLSQWEASSKNSAVQLSWTTDSEIENLGFIIDRGLTEKGPWRQIADFNSHAALKGQGSTNSVTAYTFTDEAVAVGETYYYRLSDVDYKGTRTEHDAISVTVSDKDQNALPGGFQLEKIFPNPFNPSVTIDFTVVEPTAITVNVFDLQGRLVNALIEQHYAAGNYQIQWNGLTPNGRPAPSGIYLLQIRDDAYNLVRKVVLAR